MYRLDSTLYWFQLLLCAVHKVNHKFIGNKEWKKAILLFLQQGRLQHISHLGALCSLLSPSLSLYLHPWLAVVAFYINFIFTLVFYCTGAVINFSESVSWFTFDFVHVARISMWERYALTAHKNRWCVKYISCLTYWLNHLHSLLIYLCWYSIRWIWVFGLVLNQMTLHNFLDIRTEEDVFGR